MKISVPCAQAKKKESTINRRLFCLFGPLCVRKDMSYIYRVCMLLSSLALARESEVNARGCCQGMVKNLFPPFFIDEGSDKVILEHLFSMRRQRGAERREKKLLRQCPGWDSVFLNAAIHIYLYWIPMENSFLTRNCLRWLSTTEHGEGEKSEGFCETKCELHAQAMRRRRCSYVILIEGAMRCATKSEFDERKEGPLDCTAKPPTSSPPTFFVDSSLFILFTSHRSHHHPLSPQWVIASIREHWELIKSTAWCRIILLSFIIDTKTRRADALNKFYIYLSARRVRERGKDSLWIHQLCCCCSKWPARKKRESIQRRSSGDEMKSASLQLESFSENKFFVFFIFLFLLCCSTLHSVIPSGRRMKSVLPNLLTCFFQLSTHDTVWNLSRFITWESFFFFSVIDSSTLAGAKSGSAPQHDKNPNLAAKARMWVKRNEK